MQVLQDVCLRVRKLEAAVKPRSQNEGLGVDVEPFSSTRNTTTGGGGSGSFLVMWRGSSKSAWTIAAVLSVSQRISFLSSQNSVWSEAIDATDLSMTPLKDVERNKMGFPPLYQQYGGSIVVGQLEGFAS